MRLMKNATTSSTNSTVATKKRRRRHYTDPESRKGNIEDKIERVVQVHTVQNHLSIVNGTPCSILGSNGRMFYLTDKRIIIHLLILLLFRGQKQLFGT